MKKVFYIINPVQRFGSRKYSIVIPLIFTALLAAPMEVYIQVFGGSPESVALYAIFLFIAAIMYFSFRDGVRGGIAAVVVTGIYYGYIITSRGGTPEERLDGWRTAALLILLYLAMGLIIGWLREKIDRLIDNEANEKKRLQSIIQQLPVGVVLTDSTGRIVMSNKQLELIQGGKIRDGFTVGKDTVNNAFYKGRVVLPKQWPLAQALSTGKSVVGKEFHIRRRDGKDMHVQVSASLVRNREGKVIAAASIINDITALIELEARKDDFVNMASHELKTPITSLKLYIDVLKRVAKEYKDEKVKRTLKGIEYQTDRLQQLVSDLLDVSRLQTGKLVFSREKFRIDMLVEEIVEGLRGSVMGHRIVIKEKPHLVVYADRFRIYQVVTNLLTNAIKYSPEGSIITVSVREDKKYAVVAIKDQGIGISKDQQSKIFDRLYQVTDSREKTFPGLGMGLYISKEIIKRHRGRIWVESEKGKGSTFFFSLPLKS